MTIIGSFVCLSLGACIGLFVSSLCVAAKDN
jgi:hypothetical protein